MSRASVRFLRNGKVVELKELKPEATLLDYLRLTERATGTKEGCAEGDCGACTVALGRVRNGRLVYEPVNACVTLLGTIDAMDVVAVEDIAAADGAIHPVQRAMVDRHGSQCGFCTPGFVMSLFTLFHATDGPVGRQEVNDWIAGNLCRCTGYRPIVDAALEACSDGRDDRHSAGAAQTVAQLNALDDRDDIFIGNDLSFFAAPASLDSLGALLERYPMAVIVGGGTDVGLWITKQLRELPRLIALGRVRELSRIEDSPRDLVLGASVSFAAAEPHLAAIDPDLGELFRRIGARQVRAAGTVGGNIANGSPIGDSMPALIALGARVEVSRGRRSRTLALEDLYVAYGKQNRAPGEFVASVTVPKLGQGQIFRAFKVSKRFDQDISAVLGAFRLTVANGTIFEARIAYGGMAATPKRAPRAEAVLKNTRVGDTEAWGNAFNALKEDFSPIDDHRASGRYRSEVAQALLGKALIETAGTSTSRTRLLGRRERLVDAAG